MAELNAAELEDLVWELEASMEYADDEGETNPYPPHILEMFRTLIANDTKLSPIGLFFVYEYYKSKANSGADQSDAKAAEYCLRAAQAGDINAMWLAHHQPGVSENDGLVWLQVIVDMNPTSYVAMAKEELDYCMPKKAASEQASIRSRAKSISDDFKQRGVKLVGL